MFVASLAIALIIGVAMLTSSRSDAEGNTSSINPSTSLIVALLLAALIIVPLMLPLIVDTWQKAGTL